MIKTSSVWALVWYQLVPWVALDPSRRESRLYTNILSLPLCYYYFSSIKCPKNSWYTNHTVYRNSVCMRYDAIILFIFAAAAFAIREHWQITRSAHINTFINKINTFSKARNHILLSESVSSHVYVTLLPVVEMTHVILLQTLTGKCA